MESLYELRGMDLVGNKLQRPTVMTNRDFDIYDSVNCLRYYAGWADKIMGQVRSKIGSIDPNSC